MKLTHVTMTCVLCMGAPALAAQTIVIDGVNDFASTPLQGTSGSTWYQEHDATNLYIGFDAADVASNSSTKFVTIYINSLDSSGTSTGANYNTQQPGLPFDADFHFRWRSDNGYTNMLDYNSGTGSWTDDNTGADNFGIQAFQSGTYVEFAIPLAEIGNPGSVQWAGAMINEDGGAEFTFFATPGNSEGYDADFSAFTTLTIDNGGGSGGSGQDVPFLPWWGMAALLGGLGAGGARLAREEDDESV